MITCMCVCLPACPSLHDCYRRLRIWCCPSVPTRKILLYSSPRSTGLILHSEKNNCFQCNYTAAPLLLWNRKVKHFQFYWDTIIALTPLPAMAAQWIILGLILPMVLLLLHTGTDVKSQHCSEFPCVLLHTIARIMDCHNMNVLACSTTLLR